MTDLTALWTERWDGFITLWAFFIVAAVFAVIVFLALKILVRDLRQFRSIIRRIFRSF